MTSAAPPRLEAPGGWEPVHLPAPSLGQERLLLRDRRPHQLGRKWGELQRQLTPLRRSPGGLLVGRRFVLFLNVARVSDGLYPTVGTSPEGRRPGWWSWQERASQLRRARLTRGELPAPLATVRLPPAGTSETASPSTGPLSPREFHTVNKTGIRSFDC